MNAHPFDSNDNPDAKSSRGAYLILRSGSRWSDVFRLFPPTGAFIGRASSNEIAIRSDQASRQHAAIEWVDGEWCLRDLGSRNGTFLNHSRLDAPQRLSDGDLIQVAGFAIQFSRTIEIAPVPAGPGRSPEHATDDQMTIGPDDAMDESAITDRRRHSRFLGANPFLGRATSRSAPASDSGDRSPTAEVENATGRLLQLAFSLASAETAAQAIDRTIETLAASLPLDTIGIYAWDRSQPTSTSTSTPTLDTASLVATRQNSTHAYRRPPASLVSHMIASEGQAILARNIGGDSTMAAQNTQGEIEVESLIVAPILKRDGRLVGFVHLTTAIGRSPFESESLEFVVASMEILAESLLAISDRNRLSKKLTRSRRHIEQLQAQLGDHVKIIGESPAIQELSEKITLAGPTGATVLIRGESGVGKELVAAAIHRYSPRRDGPMLCINCAALSPMLLESELFGHEKGAFTGATERKLGKFEAADGGTLLLDEIGEMSAETQAKFLRVLEGQKFERVGGSTSIQTDVRVIAATNRDLQAMVREGKFRQDLYYRLHVVEILVPPLRQRGDDCLHLAEYYLERFNREMNRRIERLTDRARQKLLAYDWPGNIRELKNVIERAVVLGTKDHIDADDLLLSPSLSPQGAQSSAVGSDPAGEVELTLAELEQRHIERVLRHTQGNKSRAASILGIERSTLDRKLKRFD